MKSSLFTCSSKPQTHFFNQCSGLGKCIIQAFRTQHTFAEFHTASLLLCFHYARVWVESGGRGRKQASQCRGHISYISLLSCQCSHHALHSLPLRDWLVNSESPDLTSIYKFGGWKSHCRWLQLKFTKALENPLVFIPPFFFLLWENAW